MNVSSIDALSARSEETSPTISEQFLQRWSPRALSGQAVKEAQINSLIEAARWAPSCFNAQPWRFAVARAGTEEFDRLLETLVDANQAWAKNAGALIAIISRTQYERNDAPAPTHSFDTGAAWMSVALQAQAMGLATHGMQGFDQDSARSVLAVPEVYDLPALIAIGYPGEVSSLPEDYQARETPSDRKLLAEILFNGNFEALES